MKDSGEPPSSVKKEASSDATSLFGKGRYKFWALAAILLLAFWSMLTGSVSLKWSSTSLNPFPGDLLDSSSSAVSIDVLEMEEREKTVRRMWDIYAHGLRSRLPRFWRQAFEAAYEDLAGDDPELRDAAVAEIARMSLRMLDSEPPPASRESHGGRIQRLGMKLRSSQ
ncbi:hypothetical protein IHE45_02G013800 [Dioscorea alata]|uniref:Uncharacterized protein n=3 Tax=Dioscorea alata TaxID=55571 RepID=A0ACB7WP09_DIOAL|nr:hypothetical protein IHE45_02G013800 [Dioscorea alata]KAH7689921.1 hypothetical protein IHE45_02G013800 [Dioscorea alata]KAH7689922.1 hypothetical protein IHE45_02G013800 [Dioscorea alata]